MLAARTPQIQALNCHWIVTDIAQSLSTHGGVNCSSPQDDILALYSILNNAELIFANFELKGLSLKGEALVFSVDFDHPI